MAVWTDEQRRGFSIRELAEHTYGISERTVRRCIEEMEEEEIVIQKEDGKYYPMMNLQPTIHHR